MRKPLFLILTLCCALCTAAELKVCTGLAPVANLAEQIGGTKVKVTLILPEGRSPHDYAPGPRELRDGARCQLFLTTGMIHEQRFAKALSRKIAVLDVTHGIKRIPLEEECEEEHHGKHAEHHHHDHGDDGADPHVWLSPENAAAITGNIGEALARHDSANAAFYRANAKKLSAEFLQQHAALQKKLFPYKGRAFFVYHPAFGYFAHAYGLHQKAIELGGREATPARMKNVIRAARKDGVRTIFVQKQFNPASGRALGKAINGKVEELDPLAGDLKNNFNRIAEALQQGFSSK